jgi:serine/threonine-protein kinase
MADLPGPRDASPAALVADGYHVCAVMDQYPTDLERVYEVVYPHGAGDLARATGGQMAWLEYSAQYLCPRHAEVWSNF